MTTKIDLMSEWGISAFRVNDGTEVAFSLLDPEDFQRFFALPDHILDALVRWDAAYQALLDWNDPGGSGWADEDDHRRWIECGRAAARALRAHVPPEVEIRYLAAGEILAEHL